MEHKFPCGCTVPIIDSTINPDTGLPTLLVPYDKITEDLNYGTICRETMRIFQNGNTKGIFQLEKNLGKTWAKLIQPQTIDDIAALISIIRPGSLNAELDGKNMSQHYVDRKHNKEATQYEHPALEQFLSDTYGVIVYQEQAIKIASGLAGFSLEEADALRRAISKKSQELMNKIEQQFIEGCKNVGTVSEEQAKTIFSWIRAGSRYSFNKSHAIGYAINAYLCAWVKYHLPLHFYRTWIGMAHEKPFHKEEMMELVYDARECGVEIVSPSILRTDNDWAMFDNKKIRLGLGNIAGMGSSHITQLKNTITTAVDTLNKPLDQFNWLEYLMFVLSNTTEPVAVGLVSAGAIPASISRREQLHELTVFTQINAREKNWLLERFGQYDTLSQAIELGLESAGKNRCFFNASRQENAKSLLCMLNEPPTSTEDNIQWIINKERAMFGVSISHNTYDKSSRYLANTTCQEIKDGKNTGNMYIVAEIIKKREFVVKNGVSKGEKMGYITVADETGTLDDIVIFPDLYNRHICEIYEGNLIMLKCYIKKGIVASSINVV